MEGTSREEILLVDNDRTWKEERRFVHFFKGEGSWGLLESGTDRSKARGLFSNDLYLVDRVLTGETFIERNVFLQRMSSTDRLPLCGDRPIG